ncbi:MAG: hypothetical protein V3R99_09930, partial [Thermoguttaceae bacterium]
MSLFRLPKFQAITSTVQRIQDRFARRANRSVSESAYRSLQIDPLEERQLLSVTPAHVDDTAVNQTPIRAFFDDLGQPLTGTIAAQSLAVDHDGDFVVTWTHYEDVYERDPNTGEIVFDLQTGLPIPVIDPDTGGPMTDANIYARYFTDEVQRLNLPAETAEDNTPAGMGGFTLHYGGNETQQISITATHKPAFDPLDPFFFGSVSFLNYQEPIAGTFTLGFDLDGNGLIGGNETTTIVFDEMPAFGETGVEHLESTATTMQTGLQGLGGALADVTVEALNPHEYVIQFGDASKGLDQPELVVQGFNFTTGFLPAVRVTTTNEPVVLGPIPVSPDDPRLTALSIEQAFAQTATTFVIGPIDFPPEDRANDFTSGFDLTQGPYLAPQIMRTPVPEVSVIARSTTEFDIRFIGDAGKQNHPEMVVMSAADDYGNPLHDQNDPLLQSPEAGVTTLKQSSDEFRVNPIEYDNPYTILPDVYAQKAPSIAMDADGEFVITWSSEVSNTENFGSVSDIYARRFTVTGVVDPSVFVPGQVVPGIRALAVPSAVDAQILTFDPTGAAPLTGEMQLRIGGYTTGTINFDSDDLDGVAAAIQAELVDAGYEGVLVASTSTTAPYEFRVRFSNDSAGIDQPPIEYVPVLDPILGLPVLGAAVSIEDEAGDLSTFRVNQMTTNAQFDASVGMDDAGNFTIAWANDAQDISFFNGISAQRFDRHGNRIGNEFQVNVEDTAIHFDPYVAMSADGHTAIAWTRTSDPDYLIPDPFFASVEAQVFDPTGAVVLPQFAVGGAVRPSAAFDMNNNVVFAWDEFTDSDNIGVTSEGVYGIMYQIYDPATGAVDAQVIRDTFRANSASLDTATNTLWPLWQGGAQAVVDADGDLLISYDGYGPDVSTQVSSSYDVYDGMAQALQMQINAEKNADLLPYFDPSFDTVYGMGSSSYSGDIDAIIEGIMIDALDPFFTTLPATDEQLGRLRAILDSVVGLLRGEANAAMFSRWDADPTNGVLNSLFSDSVANAKRDGHNSRYLIALDESISGGDFVLRFYHPYYAGWNETAAINVPVFNNTTIVNTFDLADNIENALEALTRTGINWWDGGNVDWGEGGVDVRPVSTFELQQREGTPWAMTTSFDPTVLGYNSIDVDDYVFEVTLQGELHDVYSYSYDLYLAPNGNNLQIPPRAEVQTISFDVTTDGWFALEIDTDQSADILFDSTNPSGMAAAIQAELIAMGNDDTTVTYMGLDVDGVTLLFEVTFDGDSAGTDYEPITLIVANDHDVASGDVLLDAVFNSTEDVKGADDLDAPPPEVVIYSIGDEGTIQTAVSVGMEPDGDFVIAWTQQNNYTEGSGFFGSAGVVSNQTVFFRTFDESTDTAGPMVTDLIAPSGKSIDPAAAIQGPLQHIVLVFDEELAQYDDETIAWAIAEYDLAVDGGLPITGTVSAILDSVTNVLNYRLFQNGAELPETIYSVEFGMSKAAELADAYGLNPIPTNKWEAVITFDGNGVDPDETPLVNGLYTIEVLTPIPDLQAALSQSGIRDKSGVPLNHTGFAIGGLNVSRDFIVVVNTDGTGTDIPVTQDPPVGFGSNGRTYPEVPGAVAVDSDGDHVVTWTAFDTQLQRERVFVRTYDANGSPTLTRPFYFPVTPPATDPEFADDEQRYATVASDADGDFIVTWTNFRDTNSDGVRDEQDIYMRRFDANGFPVSEPMRVNAYTTNNQKWSSVAMDVDGDFVVTWSSYSQEDNNQLGTGYGIYARQFDSFGQALAPEFHVNVTTVGNQQFASVAMDEDGDFVVVWTSDQNGIGDDIIARSFARDGAPQPGPLTGEVRINPTTDGNQRYPDIATNLAGDQFVVTWSSSGQNGPDSGWDVYGIILDAFLTPDPLQLAPFDGEFQVNTTLTGNQMFSSVAMDYEGEFTVAWSGYGDQPGQEDFEQSGVFYQRFGSVTTQVPIIDPVTGNPVLDANGNPTFQTVISTAPSGQETRINYSVAGSQQIPSIGGDADGNFVVAWTGTTGTPGVTDVYTTVSYRTLPAIDTTGPIVTDVQQISGKRMLQGDVVSDIGELIVVFNEDLSELDDVRGMTSVLNPNNWALERNGTEIIGAIKSITFGLNAWQSRKYEARVLLDGNGMELDPNPNVPPQLTPGDYVLTVRDLITDGVAALDGDYDSVPGTDPAGTGQDGFKFKFSVSAGPNLGAEFRINESTIYDQRLAESRGTGYATEQSSRAMAVDHDGDFVVVWTSTGQDDTSDPYGTGVYFRMFDRDNNALTPETRVNTTTEGGQLNASVAIDADGEFVVVWESRGHGLDNSSDIFGQRYDSMGQPVGGEFRINSETYADQYNPAVAMDDFGNFAVVWASAAGQPFSYFHNIKGQVYDYAGRPIGEEFRVNELDLPGTGSSPGGHEGNPTIAMDPAGNIIVAWERVTVQQNGVVTDNDIVGRLFGRYGAPKGPEQIFGTGGTGGGPGVRTARNPQLATDPSGNFIVVWESHNGTDYDIAYQQYDPTGAPLSGGSISEPFFGGQQVNPSVGIDADGDFAVVWNGNGAETDPLNPADPDLWGDLDNDGVFIRNFHAANNFVTVQSRVNRTENRIQHFPVIGMEPDGDRIVVWSGTGVGDYHGIFARRYDEPLDTAGPLATELRRTDTGALVVGGDYLPGNLDQIAVVFDEEMAVSGDGSVLNLDNWTVIDGNGQEVGGAISHITFSLNPLNNKFEAVVHFNGAGLGSGYYELIVGEYTTDLVGNEMRHSGVLPGGQDDAGRRARFTFQVAGFVPGPGMEFLVNQTTDGTQTFSEIFGSGTALEHSNRSLAVDHDGDFVVVWTGYDQDGDGAGVFMRMYDRDNVALTDEMQINTFTDGDQRNAEVAIDADGDFVVVWESEGQDPDGSWGIYARRFNSVGEPLEAEEFRVTTQSLRDQFRPAVAMDDVGNFVVVWGTVANNLDFFNDVHAQLFDYNGDRVGLEFRVNDVNVPAAGGTEMNPAVAMNAQGDFFVAWEVINAQFLGQPTDTIVMAKHFFADGTPQGAEFRGDNGQGQGGQGIARTARNPQVFLADNGDYSISWEYYFGVPGAGGGYSAFVESYSVSGAGLAGWNTPPLPIPVTGNLHFVNPSIATDADGNGLFLTNAHWAQLDATDPTNPLLVTNEDNEGVFLWPENSLNELFDAPSRVNRTEYGTQHFGSVGMTRDGGGVIVWSGNGIGDDQGIFARRYEKPFDMIGPMLTEVRLTDRTRIDAQEPVVAAPQELVVVFDEAMLTQGPDSVTNPDNWVLLRNGVEMEDIISSITFGLNPATNKYEALLQFASPLTGGVYTLTVLEPIPDNPSTTPIEGRSGLRDASGNPISRLGLVPDGAPVSHSFILGLAGGDTPVVDSQDSQWYIDGATRHETPGAVAVDADGDHVVAFTATDFYIYGPNGTERAFVQLYNADGSPNLGLIAVTLEADFSGDIQRFASVACDADGDFVVTWTNLRDVDDDGIHEEQDIYAQRFDAVGRRIGLAFRVNDYTNGAQKWSSVAMDTDGDFVITWSSYGQESGTGELGFGYGVYARRYDSLGEPLAVEMLVNTTITGDQQFASVAMDTDGDFVVTWSSDQSGVDNDVYARSFDAATGTFGPETLVNTTVGGDQLYSDVAIDLPGNSFVVTWSGSGSQDGDGFGVFARHFIRAGGAIFPTTGEVQVNTTTLGDQQFASVGMDHQGNFTVTWSGFGDQQFQEDESGSGVFFQRYDATATPIGGETRATITTAGDQRAPSIASDGEGNFVIVFTGDNAITGSSDVYRFLSTSYLSAADADGPLVTDVTLADRTRLLQGETVPASAGNVAQLIVLFSEDLSTRDGAAGPDSVLNPSNWKLYHNGTEITGAITSVTFSRPLLSNKYQALVTLDGNGMVGGTPALGSGEYVLTVRDSIHDVYTPDVDGNYFGGNALDGDFDGTPGATAPGLGVDGYRFQFQIGSTAVDTPVQNGRTHAETPNAVAVDADGDHVVVWTDRDNANRDHVNVQLFDADGTRAATARDPFRVAPVDSNETDEQRFGSVAIDADGDFVVTWTNIRGGEYDIYAQRFNAAGTSMGNAFRVNTYTNDVQKWSDVAMDTDGDFVVTWTSYGQEAGTGQLGFGTGVYARQYDSLGEALGPEFLVNQTITGNQRYASVAMDADGDFVVAWTSDQNGDDDIYARDFLANGTPGGAELMANWVFTGGHQQYPDVAGDMAGDSWVITWTSLDAQDGDGAAVYARTFDRSFFGSLTSAWFEFQVNTTTTGDQMFSSVTLDADGSYVIAWSGVGEQPQQEDESDFGVFYQRYASADDPFGGTPIGGETRANTITDGNQWLPSLGSDAHGNFVLVWTGEGASTNVYKLLSADRLPAADDSGPIVTDVLLTDRTRVFDGDVIDVPGSINQLTIVFSEDLSIEDLTTGADSVLNPANWIIERDGQLIQNAVTSVTFQRNPSSRKYETVLQLDGNGLDAGSVALLPGSYTVTIRDLITDGTNALDTDYDGVPGTTTGTGVTGYQFRFVIPSARREVPVGMVAGRTHYENSDAIAVDADGDHVVVWTEHDVIYDLDRIYVRLYDANGNPAQTSAFPFQVTPYGSDPEFKSDDQRFGAVATDADGDFVVTWTNIRNGEKNIYARRFNANGIPMDEAFLVNTYTHGTQAWPSVAMDTDGDFVITWSSYGQEGMGSGQSGFGYGVYARQFDSLGEPVGPDFRVNQTLTGDQRYS